MRNATEDMQDEALAIYQRLEQARDALEMAEMERNNFIASAYEDGVPAADLGTMFQLSRQMVHRIVNNTIEVNKGIEKRVLGPSTYTGSKNHTTR